MSRTPIDAVLATLAEQPSAAAVARARSLDMRARLAAREAAAAVAAGTGAAEHWQARARELRRQALAALGEEPSR